LCTWIHPYAWWLNSLFQSNGEKFIISFVGKHVLDYKSALEDKREGPLDFVQRWLNVQESDPDKMSMREIFIGAGQNIGAGSDTTSATFSAIFYYLCQNPELMKKLRLELAEAKEKGELSNLAKYQEAAKLPYLQAVIKEGMRLHPVAAFPIPRVIPKGGATLVGRHFREGDVIGINPYVSHRNKTVFGEDPDSFRPERWLVAKDQSREMERYSMAVSYASSPLQVMLLM
jgi:cytochrome P450